ncbi:hypothetical protein PS928_06626 [Pseudomonas fluorescens]|uniref:Uncharacterized protein n=1 Tax=Pseudomonas fluorescens TaxID=294 RepID=A0A5E7VUV9_PSEFL|nr:hypothetical protein PS928_06626 [Pseudomonas fluorescens]
MDPNNEMSGKVFYDEVTAELNRLDGLFNGDDSLAKKCSVSSIELECPGLAVVASRSPATRNAVLASIIEQTLTGFTIADASAISSVFVFANAARGLLRRELIAAASGVSFITLDHVNLTDEDWPKLTDGINFLSAAAGIEDNPGHDKAVNPLGECCRIHWQNGPITVDEVKRALAECVVGSTVIVENVHLLYSANLIRSSLSELRNCAAARGVFLYLGVGLSHWPDVRKTDQGYLFLTDLPEAYAEIVHIADKITMFAPSSAGTQVTIFDPRYVDAWRGSWAPKLKSRNIA